MNRENKISPVDCTNDVMMVKYGLRPGLAFRKEDAHLREIQSKSRKRFFYPQQSEKVKKQIREILKGGKEEYKQFILNRYCKIPNFK